MNVSGPEKLLYITVGILLLALGLVGLLIPIIPGVLFLAGAVYMLSRGSQSVRQYAESHPHLSRMQARMDRLDAISMAEKAQVAGLTALQLVVSVGRMVYVGVRRLFV